MVNNTHIISPDLIPFTSVKYEPYFKLKHIAYLAFCAAIFHGCRPEPRATIDFPGKPMVPAILLDEHERLLSTIDSLALLKDSTGASAVKLQEVMRHHFSEEEDYVLPALGLLPALATGNIPPGSEQILQLTEKLKEQYSHLLAEHQVITVFLEELLQIAKREGHTGLGAFQKALQAHAAAEQEIYFPAAMLIGEYMKLKINQDEGT